MNLYFSVLRKLVVEFFMIREICICLRVICEPKTFAGIIFHFFLEILASLKLLNYTKPDVKPAISTRLQMESQSQVSHTPFPEVSKRK